MYDGDKWIETGKVIGVVCTGIQDQRVTLETTTVRYIIYLMNHIRLFNSEVMQPN